MQPGFFSPFVGEGESKAFFFFAWLMWRKQGCGFNLCQSLFCGQELRPLIEKLDGSAKTAQAKFGEICSETSWTCQCEIGNNKDGRKLLLRGFVSKFFDVGRCPIWQRAYVSKRVETTTSDFCDPKIVAVVFGAKE